MPASELLAVIGDPIAHSLSPAMQTAALRSAGLEWTYSAERVPGHELAAAVRRLKDSGYRGFNVTIPHKQEVRSLVDREDETAGRAGAVNTVVRSGTDFVGYNTDIGGFTEALRTVRPLISGTAIVFGTGGSARAVAIALSDLGMPVGVVSRERERAATLINVTRIDGMALIQGDAGLMPVLATASVVVNATPLGMAHLAGQSPLQDGARLRSGALAIDLVYGRDTLFLQQARAHGLTVMDGLEMLIQQGALSFTLWTGLGANRDAMRTACLAALEERHAC